MLEESRAQRWPDFARQPPAIRKRARVSGSTQRTGTGRAGSFPETA